MEENRLITIMKSKKVIIAVALILTVPLVGLYFMLKKQKASADVHAKCTTTYCSM